MEVTGYRIREALRRWQLRRDTAAGEFKGTLLAFPDDQKPTPDSVAERLAVAEAAISSLQVTQSSYNLGVQVLVGGELRSLMHCIKLVGGLGRLERAWRDAAVEKEDRYGYGSGERTAGTVVKARTISHEEAAKRTERYAAELAELREAIALGNSTPLDIDLDVRLLA